MSLVAISSGASSSSSSLTFSTFWKKNRNGHWPRFSRPVADQTLSGGIYPSPIRPSQVMSPGANRSVATSISETDRLRPRASQPARQFSCVTRLEESAAKTPASPGSSMPVTSPISFSFSRGGTGVAATSFWSMPLASGCPSTIRAISRNAAEGETARPVSSARCQEIRIEPLAEPSMSARRRCSSPSSCSAQPGIGTPDSRKIARRNRFPRNGSSRGMRGNAPV